MMNWETRKTLRCGRTREVCIFGLGSTFNVATNSFLNILFFFPSVSFVSCMEKSKILFITMDHLHVANVAFSRSQSQEGVIVHCSQAFKELLV